MSLDEIIDDFGDPDRTPRARGIARLAHTLPWLLGAWGVFAALEWLEIVRLEEWGTIGTLLITLPLLVILLAAALHRNLARLCVTCMQRVPADAPVRAQRYRRMLWFSHFLRPPWRYCLVFGGLFAALFTLRAVLGLDTGEATWLRAPVDLLLLGYLWSEWRHHQYRPWCSYCPRWDDDGGMREPSPDPDRGGAKTK